MKALSIVTFLAALAVALVNTSIAAALCVVAFVLTVVTIIKEGPGLQK